MMEETDDFVTEVYIQDGVVLKKVPSPMCGGASTTTSGSTLNLGVGLGVLIISEYKNEGKTIEWRPCELAEIEVEGDWNIVDTTRPRPRSRLRTKSSSSSGSVGSKGGSGHAQLKIPLRQVKYFTLSKDSSKLTLVVNKSGSPTCVFDFQTKDGAQHFVNSIKTYIHTVRSPKNPKMFMVIDASEIQSLEKSFSELDIFTDTSHDTLWSYFSRNPYDTTMTAFSKFAGALTAGVRGEKESGRRLQHSDDEATEIIPLDKDEDDSLGQADVSGPSTATASSGTPIRLAERPPQDQRRRPLSDVEWHKFLSDPTADGSSLELRLLMDRIFFGGVDPTVRRHVWKYLLGYYTWPAAAVNSDARWKEIAHSESAARLFHEQLYKKLYKQWASMSEDQISRFSLLRDYKSTIEKDVVRTDRSLLYFAEPRLPNIKGNVDKLHDILMTYLMYNFDFGYVQGMNDLLAPILILMDDPVDAFGCFIGLMNRMSKNFDRSYDGMKEQFEELYDMVDVLLPDLAVHLQQNDFSSMYFTFRWLLLWFKREFPLDDLYPLWESLFTAVDMQHFHLFIALAILDLEKSNIITNNLGFNDILKHINQLEGRLPVNECIMRAKAMYEQMKATYINEKNGNYKRLPSSIPRILGIKEETTKHRNNTNNSNGNNSVAVLDTEYNVQEELDFQAALHSNFL